MSIRAKSLVVTADVAIQFDVASYALSYGLDEDAVWADALNHLTNLASEAVREAVERLGLGDVEVRLSGSRVYVSEHKEVT